MSLMSDLRRVRQARLHRQAHGSDDSQNQRGASGGDRDKAIGAAPFASNEIHTGEHHQSQPDRRARKKPDETLANWTIAVAVFTGVLAVASIVGDVFSYFTLRAIKGQLDEMKSGGEDTKKIISANAKLADTADKNLIATQRAWVGPISASIVVSEDHSIVKGSVSYVNTGKEPAKTEAVAKEYLFPRSQWEASVSGQQSIDLQNECLKRSSISGYRFAWPTGNAQSAYSVNVPSAKIPEPNVYTWDNDLRTGRSILVIQGCITYEAFSILHRTSFCYFYDALRTVNINNLNICAYGNDVN